MNDIQTYLKESQGYENKEEKNDDEKIHSLGVQKDRPRKISNCSEISDREELFWYDNDNKNCETSIKIDGELAAEIIKIDEVVTEATKNDEDNNSDSRELEVEMKKIQEETEKLDKQKKEFEDQEKERKRKELEEEKCRKRQAKEEVTKKLEAMKEKLKIEKLKFEKMKEQARIDIENSEKLKAVQNSLLKRKTQESKEIPPLKKLMMTNDTEVMMAKENLPMVRQRNRTNMKVCARKPNDPRNVKEKIDEK